MGNISYDVIIPIAAKDISFLSYVIKYIRKNLIDAKSIYIITNKKNFKNRVFKKIDDCELTLLDENDLIEGLTFTRVKELLVSRGWYNSPGWYMQQFLKMGFAQTKYARNYYLSWDSDTLPLSKIQFFEGNHPVFTIKTENHKAYFETIKNLLGLEVNRDFSYIAEHMMFDTKIMNEMLTNINNTSFDGITWFEKIISSCNFNSIFPGPHFSEFETYGEYCAVYYPNLYKHQELATFRGAGCIRGRHPNKDILDRLSFDLDTASFELYDKPLFPYSIPYYILITKDKMSKIRRMPLSEIMSVIRKKIFK